MGDYVQMNLDCFKPNNQWPSPSKPGLPNLTQGFVAATQAGCLFLKIFLPPNPLNPAIPPPMPLFLGIMLGAVDQSGAVTPGMINALAFMLFQTFTLIALSIDALSPMVPPQGAVEGFFTAGLGSAGIPPGSIPTACFPKTCIAIIHDVLGI